MLSIPVSSVAVLPGILKVVKGANFDKMKITGASLLFQTDFPKLLF